MATVDTIRIALKNQLGEGAYSDDITLFELGCDSLDMIETVMELENLLDCAFDERRFKETMTIKELAIELDRQLSSKLD